MKILFIARPNLQIVKGGDTVQINNTAIELRKLGMHVDIATIITNIDFNKYDLIHFFNIIDCEDLIGPAMACNIPYVISTIYVDYSEYDKKYRSDIVGFLSKFFSYDQMEYFKTLAKFMLKGEKVSTWRYFLKGHRGSIRYLLNNAACLLPNSNNEYKRLAKDYKISSKYAVVPNGIDTKKFILKQDSKVIRDTLLCVARIEGRKNQLNLIKALSGLNIKTVLIGAISPNQKNYYQKCLAAADEQITFVNEITQEELLSYYAKAKVHILPSWFETTGLSSLEAGVMGCNLVVGDRGDVRDYFSNLVDYCNPADIESIKQAVLTAWNKPHTTALKDVIVNDFNWKKAAEATLAAYQEVLNNKNIR